MDSAEPGDAELVDGPRDNGSRVYVTDNTSPSWRYIVLH